MVVTGCGLANSSTAVGVDEFELEPLSGLEDNFSSSRLAFCSCTLEKKLELMIKKMIYNTILGI